TNERGEVVPRGVPGELRIAGEGLSPGYLGNPELTDRAFILDPTTGTRWYRTGDLVRQDDDGQLQWLARVDRQVKISGRRLEPAEVERVIENHPGVDRCAVVLSDCLGRPSVHAFLVPVDSAGSGATELETWLAQQRSTRPPREEEGTKSASETWKDGLSGELVSDAAAREWQEASWRRLRLDASEKVLGLGCGAQAANRLASSCGAYHGITWDPASKPQATEGPASGSAARIDPGYVHGERTFAEAPFDVIVFDDCVEDFPASDYLARELGRARAALSSRGRMLISGVRDLRLQWARALWSAVVLTSRRKTVAELRERAAAVERDEYGLVVDPKGFRDWAGPCVARLRRGRHWHERNRYRYDVVVGRDVFAAGSDLPEQTWPTETSLESVARAVCESGTGVVLRGIPNGRLDAEATLVRLVSELPADTSIDSLVTRVNAERRRGEDPETICQLLEGCGCLVEPLVGTADPFLFDVLILSQEHRGEPAQLPSGPPDALACNVPGPGRRDLLLTVGVRTMCRQRLPSYLVPQRIELVPSFPLTANGKLDLAGLSGPVSRASHTASQGRAPSVGLEELLAGLVCEALGLDVIAADEDVFELGATSLTAVRLGSMAREHALSITSSQLFRTRTIERLARDIEQQRASLPEPMANARFSSLAEPGGARWPDNPRVLLTGATGYVGAFLLAALLDGERCQSVLCLVRGNGPSEALARVRKSAGRVGLLAKIPWSRVDVVCGDLGEPQLGLTEPELDAIGDRCDAIVHNAARVNFLDPYAVLHATNVRGTETLVRLAMAGRSRPFHYISSVAAVGPGSTSPPDESWDASIPSDGYGRSKRGGETIVRAAADAGLPVAIYRLGVVASDERFTVAATDDWLFRWLSGVLQLGACYSGGPEEAIRHVVPVDWVAEAVVRLASGSDALQVYHLAPPNSVPAATLVRWLREAVARMVAVPHDEWLERLRSDLPFNPLIPLMDVLRDERAMPTRLQEVDSRATGLELSALGMQWPHLDATTVAGWVRLVGG
ncbi:MAG: thioester reductase domain-containing protein, partial [Myxococcales bacterium]|nr:thioester reductase domain-containing protein [Myxococcales bacterium]